MEKFEGILPVFRGFFHAKKCKSRRKIGCPISKTQVK
jgi:hypothetical protein